MTTPPPDALNPSVPMSPAPLTAAGTGALRRSTPPGHRPGAPAHHHMPSAAQPSGHGHGHGGACEHLHEGHEHAPTKGAEPRQVSAGAVGTARDHSHILVSRSTGPDRSLLMAGALPRMAGALSVVALLWLAVAWATGSAA